VIQAVWAHIAPKTALAPPSPEAKRQLTCQSVDLDSGEVQRRGGITECLRIDRRGKIVDTQYRLLSRASAYAKHERDDDEDRPARSRRREREDAEDRPARARRARAETENRSWSDGWQWSGQREWQSAPGGQPFFWGR
jgi:penicillin-binding protein 1A